MITNSFRFVKGLFTNPFRFVTGVFKSKASDGLDLKLDPASIDWSCRALDIVSRINVRTPAEAQKSREETLQLRERVKELEGKLAGDNARLEQKLDLLLSAMKVEVSHPPKQGGRRRRQGKT